MSAPRSLPQDWGMWAEKIRRAPALALFTDFDGTLSPIVRHARRAGLPAATREVLRRLARDRRSYVAIVSGRPVRELRRLVRLRAVGYIGIHGIETAWPGEPVVSRCTAGQRRRIAQAREKLEARLRGIPGLWVEDKSASVTVHYRMAPPASHSKIRRVVGAVLKAARKELKLQSGKKVSELLPAINASKGAAVLGMLRALPALLGARPLPIYLGDDTTDESAFRALLHRGLCIRVGRSSKSAAPYWVADPGEVRYFLRCLLAVVGR